MSEEKQPPDVPGVGPSLGGAGPCPTIVHGDRKWVVGHPDQRAKARLELITLETAVANHEASLPYLPAARRAKKEKEFDAAVNGGHWRTWGELWGAVNSSPDGNSLFLLSLLREHQPDATLVDANKLWTEAGRATARAFAVVVPGFFAVLVADRAEPPEVKAEVLAQSIANTMASIAPLLTDAPSTA
jgi:hypothetical protein